MIFLWKDILLTSHNSNSSPRTHLFFLSSEICCFHCWTHLSVPLSKITSIVSILVSLSLTYLLKPSCMFSYTFFTMPLLQLKNTELVLDCGSKAEILSSRHKALISIPSSSLHVKWSMFYHSQGFVHTTKVCNIWWVLWEVYKPTTKCVRTKINSNKKEGVN